MGSGQLRLHLHLHILKQGQVKWFNHIINHCCVRLCHSKSASEKELTVHGLPKCESKEKKWEAIRHDEGELFTLTEHTRVCSHHFTADDYQTTFGALKDDAVPSTYLSTVKKYQYSQRSIGYCTLRW